VAAVARAAWLFDVEEGLKELSAKGDELERLNAVINFALCPHRNQNRPGQCR